MLAVVCLCVGVALGVGASAADRLLGPALPQAPPLAPALRQPVARPAGEVGASSLARASSSTSSTAERPGGHAPARPPSRRSFTLALTGDVLPHSPVVARARENAAGTRADHDFRPMLAPVRRWLRSADLALCHLEVPLSADNSDLSSYPLFNAPQELAAALADAGYDGCSTASNHSYDQGPDGVVSTLDALDAAGLAHAGMARSRREARSPRLYEVSGVTVSHLSYATWLNGFTLPSNQPWLVASAEAGGIKADARRSRRAGAEFVVVSLHWGVEYVAQPTHEQRRLARELVASPDIDVVVGHHAHVVQPVERLRGKPVLFGLGNFLSNQSEACCPPSTQDGVIVRLTVRERRARGSFRVAEMHYIPTFVDRPGYRVLAVRRVLRDPNTDPALLSTLRSSFDRTTAAIGTAVTLWP